MEFYRESPGPILLEHGIEFFLENKPIGITTPMHMHPSIECIFVKHGLFDIQVEYKRIHAAPGDLILIQSNALHTIENIGDGMGLYYVLKISLSLVFSMFNPSSIDYIASFLRIRDDDIYHFPSDTQPTEIRQLWQAMIREYDAGEASFFAMQRLLAGEFLLSCARFSRHASHSANDRSGEFNERSVRLISESLIYINENFATPLTAAGCASLVHLSYNHYAKLFRAMTGKTFKEYLTDLRMAHAYNMLVSSSLSIYEIGTACGYDNFSYFIAEFKRKYHCPPGQFRKKISAPKNQ